MVKIVVVSHSSKIAKGIYDLTREMISRKDIVVPVGGMPDGTIGTEVSKIKEAILGADEGDGVVVIIDLGSGLINTKMAIEMVEYESDVKVLLADAPIVEGSIVAAMKAVEGASLKEVVRSAESVASMSKL